MNIAAGNPLERGKKIGEVQAKSYLERLMGEKFSGYLSVGILGKTGLEEGTVVFHSGDIVSSDYEYYRYNRLFRAEKGLERSLNALYADKGVLDSFSLSSYQVQLVLTLNEESNLKEKISRENLKLPDKFSFSFEEELMKEAPAEELSKEQILKRLGLSKAAGMNTSKETLVEKADSESKDVIKAAAKEEKKEEEESSGRADRLKRLFKR